MITKILVLITSIALIIIVVGAVLVLKGGAVTPAASPTTAPSVKGATSLEKTDVKVGDGAEAQEGSTITVKYTGTLQNGTVFDSTEKQGGTPATFQLSKGKLIDGWVQGIPGMKVGGERKLVIPPELGYGSSGTGGIPPNSTLIFDIQLLNVK